MESKKLINIAKNCGADAVKFQLFSGKILYPNNLKMQKIFKSIQLDKNWIPELKKYADQKNNYFFSSFDTKNLQFLIKKNFNYHKIASSEIINFELMKYLNKKKFKVFLSTGMSDLDDVKKAYKKLRKSELIIMQCTSLYPTKEKDVNLNVLEIFKKILKTLD